MSVICPKCNTECADNLRYCPNCGNLLTATYEQVSFQSTENISDNCGNNYFPQNKLNINNLYQDTRINLDKIEYQINIYYWVLLVLGIIFCISLFGIIIGVPLIMTAILIKQSFVVIKNYMLHNMICNQKQIEK